MSKKYYLLKAKSVPLSASTRHLVAKCHLLIGTSEPDDTEETHIRRICNEMLKCRNRIEKADFLVEELHDVLHLQINVKGDPKGWE